MTANKPAPRAIILLVGMSLWVGTSQEVRAQTLPPGFSITDVSGQLSSNATAFAVLPDERILIANQTSGNVELIVNGKSRSTPLLTVPNLRWSSEQGLLGIAIDPEFPDSNYVYLFYTRDDDLNRVSRYRIEGELLDPQSQLLQIDEASQQTVIEFTDLQPFHNGGTLRFGSDNTLYISHGDDNERAKAQDLASLNGAILRVHRNGSVPVDNPVFDPEPDEKRGEIFAMGLRNPFRFSIDPLTDELFIGEVGPEDVEELNLSTGGENFGWPTYLAEEPYRPEIPLATVATTFPIHTYRHVAGMRSVIGLLTYRQNDYPNDASFPPDYDGVHFFADFFAGSLRYIRSNDEGEWMVEEFAQGITRPVDAAMASDGGIYILEYGNTVRKITYEATGVSNERDASLPVDRLGLTPNFPNPFDRETRFAYTLPNAAHAEVVVFNVLGERIVTLHEGIQQQGRHTIVWGALDSRGRPVPPGVYLYRVKTGRRSESRSMVVR